MKTTLIKDEAILRLLEQLTEHLEPEKFDVVDHWESDLCAIGIARAGKPGFLVYVSTFGQRGDSYFVSLEWPPAPGSDLPYEPAGEQQAKSFAEVLMLVQQHLNL